MVQLFDRSPSLFLCLLTVLCSLSKLSRAVQYADIVIVGAGASGMSAASSLFQHSNLTVFVLEGRNYTGGRVHARTFGSPSVADVVMVEEGANWVHGQPPPGGTSRMKNPAWELAEQVHLEMTRIPGSCANASGYTVYDSNGKLFSKLGGAVQRKANMAFQCANFTGQNLKLGQDISFGAALGGCGFPAPPTGTAEDTVYWEVSAADYPLPISRESLKWALPDPTYMYFGPDDHFVHEQRPRGYATILDAMMGKTGWDRLDKSLYLGTTVTEIAALPPAEKCHSEEMVLVRSKDGREFCSRYVISTLPLGVMQKDHSTLFTAPPLSKLKIEGTNAFSMGNFTKLFLQFEENFWSGRGRQWLVANSERNSKDGIRNPMEFHDLGSLIEGSNVLFTYVDGPDTQEWSTMTDEEATNALVDLLQKHFPNIVLPKVTSFYMTRHYADAFMRGAYTVTKVGVTNKEFDDMVEPHQGKVFFAGEHTCSAFQGYVHGGILSGRRAAAEVLTAMGNAKEARKIYDCSCENLRLNRTETKSL
jgi:monoamine oxidase